MFDPSRVRVSGPLKGYAPGFVAELAGQGYTSLSATLQLRLVARLSDWLAVEDLKVSELTQPVCERFTAAHRAGGSRNLVTVKALAPLLGYLGDLGVSGPALDPVLEPVEVLLEEYGRYLTRQRGLARSTAEVYVRMVRPFLTGHRLGANGSAGHRRL